MFDNLTKDAQALIAVLYKNYLEKREQGESKKNAKFLSGGVEGIHNNLMPKWTVDDIEETCKELGRAGFLNIKYASNRIYLATLSDSGIMFMETKFGRDVKSILKFLATLAEIVVSFM